ncbi:MAG: sigma-70 family RNA polymerase sigma factor [Planctomycetota bacterium]
MDERLGPELLMEHAQFVRSLARRLLRDESLVDDVVQDTWLTALRREPEDPSRLRAWLARIARNLAFEERRTETRRRRRERRAAKPEPLPSTEEILVREALRRRVVEAVLSLHEPYRTTVLLRFFEDLPPRAIARRLDVPVETVKTRLRRAFEKLRVDLQHERTERRQLLLGLAGLAGLRSELFRAAPVAAATSSGAGSFLGALIVSTPFKVASVTALVWIVAALSGWPAFDGESSSVAVGPKSAVSPEPEATSSRVLPVSEPEPAGENLEAVKEPKSVRKDIVILGRVLGPDGQPFEGATIELAVDGVWNIDRKKLQASDEEGRFRLELEGSPRVDLVAFDRDGQFASVRLDDVPAGDEVTLQFVEPESYIDIEVVDEQGQPIDWWGAMAIDAERKAYIGNPSGVFRNPKLTGEEAERSDARLVDRLIDRLVAMDAEQWARAMHRQFEAAGPAPDGGRLRVPWRSFRVLVRAQGYEPVTLGPFDPGNAPRTLAVTLTSFPIVTGRVMSSEGPVEGARVGVFPVYTCPRCVVAQDGFILRNHPRSLHTATSGANGDFEIRLEAMGTYVVRAEADGLAPATLGPRSIDPLDPTEDLQLSLEQPASIEGTVRLPDGLDRDRFRISAFDGNASPVHVEIDEDGRYGLTGLTPGAWRITPQEAGLADAGIAANGFFNEPHDASDHEEDPVVEVPPLEPNATLEAGGEARLDFDLGAMWSRLTGSLTLGAPGGWRMTCQPAEVAGWVSMYSAELSETGEFELEAGWSGAKQLGFGRETDRTGKQSIRVIAVLPAGASELHITIPVGRLVGQCASDPERPWIHYRWTGLEQRSGTGSLEIGDAETFTFEDVPAGAIEVWRSEKGWVEGSESGTLVEIGEGETGVVVLE